MHLQGASESGAWRADLGATRVGRERALRVLDAGRFAPTTDDRLELSRGGGVHEWYQHATNGVEHGLDLTERPSGMGQVVVEISVTGLAPSGDSTGSRLALRDARGITRAWYGDLVVRDANGTLVPATLTSEAGTIVIRIDDAHATWPLDVDPYIWNDDATLSSTDAQPNDCFGENGIAISNGEAIVGAVNATTTTTVGTTTTYNWEGAAYVFTAVNGSWTQQAKLTVPATIPKRYFGVTVAIDGDSAFVADYLNLYVFTRAGTTWALQNHWDVGGGAFAIGASVHGVVAVGGASNSQTVAPFTRVGTTWTQQAALNTIATGSSSSFGASYKTDGKVIVVGDPAANGGIGAAFVFTQAGTTWSLSATLTPSDGASGQGFGTSVWVDDGSILVGSASGGSLYLFTQMGAVWTQSSELTTPGVAYSRIGMLAGDAFLAGPNFLSAYAPAAGGTWTPDMIGGPAPYSINGNVVFDLTTSSALIAPRPCRAYFSPPQTGDTPGKVEIWNVGAAVGAACTAGTGCASGYCADGVCCNQACTGSCLTCAAAEGAASDGTCGFASLGSEDPGTCESTCAAPGGATAKACDGSGNCVASTLATCGAYACNSAATACNTTCATDPDCATGAYCAGGACKEQLAVGSACTSNDECDGAGCFDGYCCDTACSGLCEGCAITLTGMANGQCGAVTNGTDPKGQCPGSSCDGNTLEADVCDGAGACRRTSTSCAPAECLVGGSSTATCSTTCTADSDCNGTGYCNLSTGTCSPKLTQGAMCSTADSCATGNCVDGVCCETACSGQCSYCAQVGLEGTCATLTTGQPIGSARAACTGAGTSCGGSCLGSPDACSYPVQGMPCGTSASCSGSTLMEGQACDGAGQCVASDSKNCSPFACDAQGGTCKTACSASTDCSTGYVCSSKGECVVGSTTCTEHCSPSNDGGAPAPTGDGGDATATPASSGGCTMSTTSPGDGITFGCLSLGVIAGLRRRSRRPAPRRDRGPCA